MDNNKTHVVSFSGGRTSAYLVHLMEQKRKKENIDVKYIFMDTGAEHPKTYEFIKNVVKHWGIELICLRAKVNPEHGIGVTYKEISINDLKQDLVPFHDVIKKYGTPTINAPRCSSRLKAEPHDKYCNEKFGRSNYITWLGMRIDEPRRLKELEAQNDLFEKPLKPRLIRYLAEISMFTKSDILDWWSNQPFDLEIPEHLGNCVFCIKKGTYKVALAAKEEPFMAKQFSDMLKHPETREMPKSNLPKDVIYRGYHSLDSIILLTKDIDKESLQSKVKYGGGYDANSCSESCEVYNAQTDMFDKAI